MKKQVLAGLASFALLAPIASQAQEAPKTYYGVGVSTLKWSDREKIFDGINNSAIALTLGYRVMKNLAIEGQVGTGLGDDTVTVNGTRITVKNKEFYGVYLRPYIQATDSIELYGRLGYFSGKLSASGQGVSESDRKNDTAFGVGAAYSLNKSLAITLEYNQWFDKDDIKVSGFGLGIRSNF